MLLLVFWISGNFPETAWRAIHSRQAVHVVSAISGFLKRNRLAVNSQTTRRCMLESQISGFWLSCPAVIYNRQAGRGILDNFLYFSGFWGKSDRGER